MALANKVSRNRTPNRTAHKRAGPENAGLPHNALPTDTDPKIIDQPFMMISSDWISRDSSAKLRVFAVLRVLAGDAVFRPRKRLETLRADGLFAFEANAVRVRVDALQGIGDERGGFPHAGDGVQRQRAVAAALDFFHFLSRLFN